MRFRYKILAQSEPGEGGGLVKARDVCDQPEDREYRDILGIVSVPGRLPGISVNRPSLVALGRLVLWAHMWRSGDSDTGDRRHRRRQPYIPV